MTRSVTTDKKALLLSLSDNAMLDNDLSAVIKLAGDSQRLGGNNSLHKSIQRVWSVKVDGR